MSEETENLVNIQEPDYLAELASELEEAQNDSIKLSYTNGTLESADIDLWFVIALNNKLLVIDGRLMFRGRGSASQRLRAFADRNIQTARAIIRKKLGYDTSKYPNPDWTYEKEQLSNKLSVEYSNMWKEDYAKVLSLREYREQYGALAEI